MSLADVLSGWPPPALDPAGPYAQPIVVLSWVLIAIALFVTVVVAVCLWLALFGGDGIRKRLSGVRMVLIGGLAFPAIVLSALLVYGLTLTSHIASAPAPGELRVRVTGEMWWWRVAYLDSDGREIIADANEIHIPTGQPVTFELESTGVIHSFWVPRLGGKMDMIPGRRNVLRLQADTPGEFAGQCAEFCGGPHALMGFVVIAHAPDDYERWRTSRLSPTTQLDLTSRGAEVFSASGCGACHAIAGTRANGLAAPDLTHIAARRSLGAGIIDNTPENLRRWIADSQAIKPGNRMPPYKVLSAADLDALTAFLTGRP